MKKLIGLVFALLLIATPVFADNVSQWTGYGSNYNQSAKGQGVINNGTMNTGSNNNSPSTSSATIGDIKNTNNNANVNMNSNKNDNTNVNINGGNRQGQDQLQGQGQLQGQMQGQGQVNEGNTSTITITNEKPYLNAPSTSAPEVNFGQGKVDFNFARNGVLSFDVVSYKGEKIKSLVVEKHNVKADNLISVVLKMTKDEMPITYNTRLIIVKKEAQKTYSLSLIGVPAGSYQSGAGSAVVGPSFGGTKANDLFSIYFVKIE